MKVQVLVFVQVKVQVLVFVQVKVLVQVSTSASSVTSDRSALIWSRGAEMCLDEGPDGPDEGPDGPEQTCVCGSRRSGAAVMDVSASTCSEKQD